MWKKGGEYGRIIWSGKRAQVLLEVKNLNLAFDGDGGSAPVLRGVSFGVGRGERVALVGESGCGKSMTLFALTRLPPASDGRISGEVLFEGRPLLGPHPKVAYVFQDPIASLDPVMRISAQIKEAVSGLGVAAQEIEETLEAVDLRDPKAVLRSYPCELSGGMCQRVMIAMALLRKPELLVADEPTTALDATTQADVMKMLCRVVGERGMALLMATHNLALVENVCDRVEVFYCGQIVESGAAAEVAAAPLHPYTRGLLAAVPRVGAGRRGELNDIPGEVPSPREVASLRLPDGGWRCAFQARCPDAAPECGGRAVEMRADGDRAARCARLPAGKRPAAV